jgi:hypothetical protein
MNMRLIVPTSIAVASLAFPQVEPNFSGRWILDSERSSVPQNAPRPSNVQIAVTQRPGSVESDWQLPSPSGTTRLVFRFKTDGTSSFVPSGGNERAFESLGVPRDAEPAGPDIEVSGSWKGRELTVRSKWYNPNKREVELDDTWKLSADRKTLTIDRTSGPQHSGGGVATIETHSLFVFKRASPPK